MFIVGETHVAPSDNPGEINYSCTDTAYPTELNSYCLEFKVDMGVEEFPGPGEAVVIKYKHIGREKRIVCYGPPKGRLGWCGTCTFQQKKGRNIFIRRCKIRFSCLIIWGS